MPNTFVALAVLLIAFLPGAVFTFAYESQVGQYGAGLPDRIYRFLAASAVFHALASGLSYEIYRTQIASGRFAEGKISPWAVEGAALTYLMIPFVGGAVWGFGTRRQWPLVNFVRASAPHPTAWEYLFSREPRGWMRIRLKSGTFIAGLVGRQPGRRSQAYASGPDPYDIFLSATIAVSPHTGEVITENGHLRVEDAGILIRWDEIEYLQLFDEKVT